MRTSARTVVVGVELLLRVELVPGRLGADLGRRRLLVLLLVEFLVGRTKVVGL